MKLCAVGKTDQGARRSNNEDAFIIMPQRSCCAVADGMGGAAAGEVASATFIETVSTIFSPAMPSKDDDLSNLVKEAFMRGNDRIIRSAAERPEYRGMGCTAEVIAFGDERYTVGHVGDSRTYLFRKGELRQLTKDHSLVQQQVDRGLISPQEARRHGMKNIILRALGMDQSLSLDMIRGRLLPQDTFLLCSDGLTDMVDDEEIRTILATAASLSEKVDTLLDHALKAGGKDNVTVVLCQAGSE
jgi:PPM family protein phosphatase